MNAEQRENNWACGHKSYACCGRCADDLESKVASLTAQLSESQKEVKKLKSWQLTPHNFNLMYEQEEKIKALQASLEEAQRERDWFKKAEKDHFDFIKYQVPKSSVCVNLGEAVGYLTAEIGSLTTLLEASKVREKRLREALTIAQWGDGQSECCQICDAYEPEPHKEGCVIGDALAEGKGEV